MLEILSCGCGVQSSTIVYMSIEGLLPKLDHCIFADTGWEPKAVYEQRDYLRRLCDENGIEWHDVSVGNIREDATTKWKFADGHYASMPLFILKSDGTQAKGRRQYTAEYKIRAIDRQIRSILGLAKGQRWPKDRVVRHWFGISIDEFRRTSTPRENEKWKSHFYPLCDWENFHNGKHERTGLPIVSRKGCLSWVQTTGYRMPPRSACVGCPFRSDREWKEMQENRPEEFADAVAFDAEIRRCNGMRGEQYIHRSMIPLDQVSFRPEPDYPLFGCEDGLCGT